MSAYSRTLFCRLRVAFNVSCRTVSTPMKTWLQPASAQEFDELRHFPCHQIRFDHEVECEPFLPQPDEAMKDAFPVRVSGKIIIREKEKWILFFAARTPHTAQDGFDAAVAGIVALDVDDRAEAAAEGAAASGVERMHPAEEALEVIGRILGQRCGCQRGTPTAIERFCFVSHDVSKDLMPHTLGFTMEQNHSLIHEFSTLGRHDAGTRDIRLAVPIMKHGDGTADVEPTHQHGRALRFECERNFHGPREHVGLNS